MLFFVVPPLPPLLAQVPAQVQRQKQEIGGLEVEFEDNVFDFDAGTVTFTGSVRARYDQTVVTSDRLVVDYKGRKGIAEGGVRLTDPEAFLSTERLEFDWSAKTGSAREVVVRVGNMRIWADSLVIEPEVWRLQRARATLSRRERPNYKIHARTVRIYPGKYGIANHVSLDLFGADVGTAPEMRFDLDPRIDGFNLPAFAERKGVGFGVSWSSSFLMSEQVVLGGSFGSFPNRLPSYGLNLTWMDADPDRTFRQLKPQDDLKEQMGDGWFENVSVKSPRMEAEAVGGARLLYMLATKWDTSTVGRLEGLNDVSKSFEAVVESAGTIGGFGIKADARLQSIRRDSDSPFVQRFVSQFAVLTPVWYLTGNFGVQLRADLFNTLSKESEFGWIRGLASVLWSPTQGVTMGVAVSDTASYGASEFLFDRRLYDNAVHARLDYVRGPYTVRCLLKYDPVSREYFDTEYELALVTEAFQPFVVLRQLPSEYRIGVRFRIDDFVGRLQRRKVDRTVERPF